MSGLPAPGVEVAETEAWHSGAGLISDVASLAGQARSGSWVDATLSTAALAGNGVALGVDPLGAAVAWGVGWVLDHVQPLKGWLDEVGGDADQVTAYARTWETIERDLVAAADGLESDVARDLASMSGPAVAAYRGVASVQVEAARTVAHAAGALGSALAACAKLVRMVHDLIRDAIADVVSSVVCCTNPVSAVARASRLAARWGVRLGPQVVALARTIDNLVDLVRSVTRPIRAVGEFLRRRQEGIGLSSAVGPAVTGIGYFTTAVAPFLPGPAAPAANVPPCAPRPSP